MAGDTWRDRANAAIISAKTEGESQGLSGKALERYVSEHGYPFGERAMHPYKIWLSAFKVIMHAKQFPANRPIGQTVPLPGQLSLFDTSPITQRARRRHVPPEQEGA